MLLRCLLSALEAIVGTPGGLGKPPLQLAALSRPRSGLGSLTVREPRLISAVAGSWLLMAPVLLGACFEGTPLSLPAVEGAQSLVLVAHTEPEPTVHIGDLDPGVLALPEAPVTLMHYAFDLDSLGLGPMGPLTGAATELQSLPPPLEAFKMRRGDSIEWSVLAPEDAPHASILVPRPDLFACIDDRGGCISVDAPWRCQVACPQVRPEAPTLPNMPCPPGWHAVTPERAPALQVCEPALEDLHACADGQYQAGPGLSCAPLAPCPSGPWPPAPQGAGPLLYVAVDALAGGDGSIDRPFATLGQAIQAAPARAAILLSAGTHAGGADFSRKTLHIQGLCPQLTEIAGGAESALVATNASLTLGALSLSSEAPVLVAMGGMLNVEAVAIRGQGPLLFAQGVQLSAQGLRTRGRSGGGLLIGEQSQVKLQDWDHAGPAGLSMHTGRLSVQGATLRGLSEGTAAALDLEDVSTSTFAAIQVEDVPGIGVVVRGNYRSVAVRDATLRRCGSGLYIAAGPESKATEAVPQVKLTRVYGNAHPGKAVTIGSGDVTADFISVHADRNEAISIRQQGPWHSSVAVKHLWALSAGSAVVEVGRIVEDQIVGMDVTAEDWVVISAAQSNSLFTVAVRDEASLTLKRAWIRGDRGAAIEAFCGDLDLEDLTVINGLDRGLTGQAPSVFRVRRAHFSGRTDVALEATTFTARCPGSAPADVSNVHLQGCTDCVLAVNVRSGARLRLTAALIDGYLTAGKAGGTGTLEVTSSQVTDGRLGFDLVDRAQVDGVVRGVRFDVGQSVTVSAP